MLRTNNVAIFSMRSDWYKHISSQVSEKNHRKQAKRFVFLAIHKQLLMASDVFQAVWSSAKTIHPNLLQFMIKIINNH